MRSGDHGLAGAGLFLGVAPLLHNPALPPLTPARLVAGTVLAVGGSLIPDWDFAIPGKKGVKYATPGLAFPGGKMIARTVAKLSGGHRKSRSWSPGTHSLAAAGLLGWGTWWATGDSPLASAVCVFVLTALACHLISRHQLGSLGIALAVTLAIGHWASLRAWAAVAVVVGVCSHLLGDMIATKPGSDGGIPLLWPWRRPLRIGLFETGGTGEEFCSWLMAGGVAYLAWTRL